LPPYHSQSLDVLALLASAGLKNYSGSVNLVFDVQGKPGSVLPVAGSVDQTNNYVFEAVPRGIATTASRSVSYWSTGNGDDTMVTLWNPADEAQDLVFTINYSAGHYRYPIHLAPRATYAFNISEVLNSSMPDVEGNLVPASVHDGSARLTGNTHMHDEPILVAMDEEIYNVRKATCYPTCLTCDGYSYLSIDPGYFSVAVNGQTTEDSYGIYDDEGPENDGNSEWSSLNTNVLSASGVGYSMNVTGVGVGTADLLVWDNSSPVYVYMDCSERYWSCPESDGVSGEAQGNVATVQITSADLENNLVNVTISGSSSLSSVLTVTANGQSNNAQISANNNNSVAPGQYTLSFNRPSMAADTYTTLTATWNGISTTYTLTRVWTVEGVLRHSQYNTPSESACSGTATTAWVFTSSCTFTQTTLRSDFMSQVFTNGSGTSISYGALQYEPSGVCNGTRPTGSTDQNSFEMVSAITGSCGTAVSGGYNGTVAVNPNPALIGGQYVCGDNILEVTSSNAGEALKTVADFCPACSNTATFLGTQGHIDDYSSAAYCSAGAVGDLGNFWTADTH
jgi:hypothetical protein